GLAGANPQRYGPGAGPAAVAVVLAGAVVEAATGGNPDPRGVRRDGRGRGGYRHRSRRRLHTTLRTREKAPAQALHPTGQRRRGIGGDTTPGRDDDPDEPRRGGPVPRRETGRGPAASHQLRPRYRVGGSGPRSPDSPLEAVARVGQRCPRLPDLAETAGT